MADDKSMDENELVAFLGRKIDDAMNDEDGEVSQRRQDALNAYNRGPYGDEEEDYSKFVSGDVLEAVEWALPSILRVFTSGDRVVSFDPVKPDDEEQADIETDVINHILMKENNGFEQFYNWFKEALIYSTAYVKAWPDESVEVVTERYSGLTQPELYMLVTDTDDQIEIVGQASDVVAGPEGPVEVFDVEVKRTITRPRIRVEATEPEQVLVDRDCTGLDLDEADFVAHRVKRTYTWLVNNGYDRDLLDQIGTGDEHEWNDERVNRLFLEDENPDEGDNDDPSMRQFWVHECYVKVDFDGDGVAEARRIVMIGDTIFENEEDDYQPFVALSALPMPHKHYGVSLAELVEDIQKIKTVLWRQALDNMYDRGLRRTYVGRQALTSEFDTLGFMMDRKAQIIPVNDPTAIVPEQVAPILGELFPVIEGITDQAQMRTGITPNLSLDPNVLQQSTAGAFNAALAQASERIELVTRVFAETGVRRLVQKTHRCSREYIGQAQFYQINGKWLEINPGDWRTRTRLTANVGLGFNDKATKLQLLESVLAKQEQALPIGLSDPEKIHNTLGEMVEVAGLGDVGKYFVDPATIQPQQPQPDPQAELVQAQLQLQAQQLQQQGQKQQADFAQAMAKLDIEREKIAAKAAEDEAKRQDEWQKFMFEQRMDWQKHIDTTQGRLIETMAKMDSEASKQAIAQEQADLDRKDRKEAMNDLADG